MKIQTCLQYVAKKEKFDLPPDAAEEIIRDANGNLRVLNPFNMILGLFEDYQSIDVIAKHEFILIQSKTDKNAIHIAEAAVRTKIVFNLVEQKLND